MRRILVVVTNHNRDQKTGHKTGCAIEEVSHFCKVVTEAGFNIDIMSAKGEEPQLAGYSNWKFDSANRWFWQNSSLVKKFKQPLTPDQVSPSHYSAVYFAGGHGAMWDFPDNELFQSTARQIYEQGGVVSAVCHGSAGLLNIKLSDGTNLISEKNVNGFSNVEEFLMGGFRYVPFYLKTELKKRGGKYKEGFPFLPFAVSDGRLISGQNPYSAGLVAQKLIKALES